MAALFQEEIKKNSQDIAQVFTYKDIEENEKNGKISALLSLEEGAIYQREPQMLRKFYEARGAYGNFLHGIMKMI